MLGRISIKAIVLGLVVDLVGSFVVMGSLGLVTGFVLGLMGNTPQRIQEMLCESVPVLLGLMGAGMVFTALGGYVAARVAGGEELLHGAVLGGVEAVIGLALSILGWMAHALAPAMPREPLWYTVLGVVAVLPASMAGSYLQASRVAAATSAVPAS